MGTRQNKDKDDQDQVCGREIPALEIENLCVGRYKETLLFNVGDIANVVGRPDFVITIFLGMELSTFPKFDAKTGVGVLDGLQDANRIYLSFDNFVERCVRCHACGSLETDFMASQSQIAHKCCACAHLSVVDMEERFRFAIWCRDVERKMTSAERNEARTRIMNALGRGLDIWSDVYNEFQHRQG